MRSAFVPKVTEVEVAPSAWDPPSTEEILDAGRYRTLLFEIVRRAIHDWVLYRNSSREAHLSIASDAHTWLFEEKPGHPWWQERIRNGTHVTAFLTICDLLDIDPDTVRERARKMTPQQIMTAGRPAERRSRVVEEPHYTEHGVTNSVNLGAIEADEVNRFNSSYEAHYAVYTSD